MQRQVIEQITASYLETILGKPNVVGVGTGYKRLKGRATPDLAIVVLVRQKVPRAALPAEGVVPREIDGVATDVVQVGSIRALQGETGYCRPALGGVSIGHFRVTAGTLGCVVRDRTTGARLILSNNHILANCNDSCVGDPILQPGWADGGYLGEDMIARLERFVPLAYLVEPGSCPVAQGVVDMGNRLAERLGSRHRLATFQTHPKATNRVDAAVARPANERDVADEILGLGPLEGAAEAELGLRVRKVGRTTGLTTGEIIVLDATIDVAYGSARLARFVHQIISGPMSQSGDSGSVLVTEDAPRAVGLLFAGSEQATVYNPIGAALDALEVTL